MSAALLAVVLWATPPAGSGTGAPSLSWLNQSRSNHYQAVDDAELALAESLWRYLWTGGQLNRWQVSAWSALGFEVASFADGSIGFRERSDNQRGRGSYLLRSQGPMLLQVPHRYHDRLTGSIGFHWWRTDQRVAGLALNTAPRQVIDLARTESTMLTAFGRAFVAAAADWPALTRTAPEKAEPLAAKTAKVIQLHGFATEKRTSAVARNSELILSAGHRSPSAEHRSLVNCLRDQAQLAAQLFPDDVEELGGTRNVAVHQLSKDAAAKFFHLELSSALRQRLVDDTDLLARLIACL